MKLIDRIPKPFLSFFEGFFLCFGATQSVGFVLLPFVIAIGLSTDHTNRVKTIAAAMPFISLVGLLLGLFVAYLLLQWKSDPLFRRGVIAAIVLNVLATMGSIFG